MIKTRHHTTSRFHQVPTVLAAGGLCLVALVGCASGDGARAEAEVTTRPADSSAPADTTAEITSPPSAAAGRNTSSPTSTEPESLDRCDVGQLTGSTTMDVHTNVDVDIPITLANTGGAACTLQGWPGAAFVTGESGLQVGRGGVLDQSTPHPTVTLQPGEWATFTVFVRVNQYDNATCAPRTTDGLRIIPPGSTKSLFVQAPGFEACSADIPSIIHIGGIVPANAEVG